MSDSNPCLRNGHPETLSARYPPACLSVCSGGGVNTWHCFLQRSCGVAGNKIQKDFWSDKKTATSSSSSSGDDQQSGKYDFKPSESKVANLDGTFVTLSCLHPVPSGSAWRAAWNLCLTICMVINKHSFASPLMSLRRNNNKKVLLMLSAQIIPCWRTWCD